MLFLIHLLHPQHQRLQQIIKQVNACGNPMNVTGKIYLQSYLIHPNFYQEL